MGEVTHLTRNLLGDVVEQRWGEAITAFAYDPAGRMTRAANADAEVAFEHDPLGRVLAETCNGRTVISNYDALGRRTYRRTPSGAESLWDYDANDRPTALHTSGHTMRFDYNAAGNEIERNFGEVSLTQTWDANHRLASQTLTAGAGVHGPAAPPSAPAPPTARQNRLIQRRTYDYRADGYVKAVDDDLSGARNYDLDPLGQVTAVSGTGWTERYAYDPAGNITDATWPTPQNDAHSIDAQGKRTYVGTLIRRAGRVRYERDAQGRVVLRQQKPTSGKPRTWRYTWAGDDRLVGVTTPEGQRWRYRYDALGRRVAKQHLGDDGESVVEQVGFCWDGAVLAEQASPGNGGDARRTTVWEWEPGTFRPVSQSARVPIGQASDEWIDERFHAVVTDLVGTPMAMVDADGDLAWRPQTTLWGLTLATVVKNANCQLRFPGHFDQETEANYNFFRYYDPSTSRYATSDLIGLVGGINPHKYVPNPMGWVDPLGCTPCTSVPAPNTGPAAGLAHDAASPNRIYSARELIRRAEEPGPYHNLPGSFDDVIFGQGSRTVVSGYYNKAKHLLSNDSIQYRLPGSINGTGGMYEIFARPSISGRTEVIMHRFFRPSG